jgi:hypothetical protein
MHTIFQRSNPAIEKNFADAGRPLRFGLCRNGSCRVEFLQGS